MRTYSTISSLPATLPVFPLAGVILLPRVNLPLNLFEPRYLAMFDRALAGDRLIAMVQPAHATKGLESPEGPVPVRETGSIGRITAWQETSDERYIIALSGICRCRLVSEETTGELFRTFNLEYGPFAGDLKDGTGADEVDREYLLTVLKAYLSAKDLHADWESIGASSNEFLVNTLAMISPYAPEEKQALLEAPDLKTRAEVLVALAEMELAAGSCDPGSALQ